jgi:hypothetical protein|tara:strand:- start:577 stop:768 length:192 start_codon:yes stop_codon:yes gene_type:complete
MIITKTSLFTNTTSTMDIDVTQEQLDTWKDGMLIQDAMPNLTAEHREFIMTGTTPEDWSKMND